MNRVMLSLVMIGGLLLTWSTPAAASSTPTFGTFDDAVDTISRARVSVTISAYTLDPQYQVTFISTLEKAAARHVSVLLVLTATGESFAVRQNRELAQQLPKYGVKVTLLARPIHLKAMVVDGTIVALSDENWAYDGTVLFLPSQDAVSVNNAILGKPQNMPPLTFTKPASLAVEAALLGQARKSIVVETESFSNNNPVATAIQNALKAHVAVTLIVCKDEYSSTASERAYVALLKSAGAAFRLQPGTHKGAVVDGTSAWFGSSNASTGEPTQIDSGFASNAPTFVKGVTASIASP
jgi:phosphatidylserine/phosphatidylglycerophosphate/cardiolipin synthase-like enzyme